MNDLHRTVTIIPAKLLEERQAMKRQFRVAAYCRVSTEEDEQQSSYRAIPDGSAPQGHHRVQIPCRPCQQGWHLLAIHSDHFQRPETL